MTLTEKEQIYKNIWTCAYRRRYEAQVKKDWERYYREHETILMCLKIAKWTVFDTDKRKMV